MIGWRYHYKVFGVVYLFWHDDYPKTRNAEPHYVTRAQKIKFRPGFSMRSAKDDALTLIEIFYLQFRENLPKRMISQHGDEYPFRRYHVYTHSIHRSKMSGLSEYKVFPPTRTIPAIEGTDGSMKECDEEVNKYWGLCKES